MVAPSHGRNPIVSVIVPAYNAEMYLAESISSVLDQDYPFFELLIVDDGSKDATYEVTTQFQDSRMRVFRQPNKGVSAARNLALSQMTGEYFLFLDADDKLTRESISTRLELFAQNPSLEFVDGSVQVMDISMDRTIDTRYHTFEGPPLNALLRIDSSCFFGPTWMFRVVPGRTYSFLEGLTHAEDLFFYMTVSAHGGEYKAVKDVVYQYRSGNTSAMSDLDGLWEGYKTVLRNMGSTWLAGQVTNGQRRRFKRKVTSIMAKSFLRQNRILRMLTVFWQFLRL